MRGLSITAVLRNALTALPPALRRSFLIVLLLTASGLLATGFLLPWFTQVFTDQYLIGPGRHWLGALLAGMALTALVRAALTWVQRRMLLRTQQAAAEAANAAAIEALLGAASEALATLPAAPGHLLRRQQRAYALLYGELAQGFAELPAAPLLLIVMIGFDPLLAALAALLAALNALAFTVVDRRRARLGEILAKADSQVAALVARDLPLLAMIKANAAEAAVEQRWRVAYRQRAAAVHRLGLAGQALATAPHIISGLGLAALLAVGAGRIIEGAISVGDLVACQTLLFSINDALQRFIEASRLYPEVAADLERRQSLLELAQEATGEPYSQPLLTPGPGALQLEGIEFMGLPVRLALPPGAQLGIRADEQGESHTLCRVLAGLENAPAARVRLDGVVLQTLPVEQRANAVALVDSSAVPFDDSLRENVRLWNLRLDDDTVKQALYLAGFEEALKLPGGLGRPLGRRELSGGQLRRVALAQALIRRPRLIVLDGALEALDIALVRRIFERLAQAGLTTVLTSPRQEVLALCRWRLVAVNGVWVAEPAG